VFTAESRADVLSKKFLMALLIIGAIATGLVIILVIGLFTVDEDGRSRDNGAPSPHLLHADLGPTNAAAAPLRMFPPTAHPS